MPAPRFRDCLRDTANTLLYRLSYDKHVWIICRHARRADYCMSHAAIEAMEKHSALATTSVVVGEGDTDG